MKTINKFILLPNQQFVLIPSDKILSASIQGNDVAIYALVDSEDREERPFEFKIYSTGQEVDINGYEFLSTVRTNGNDLHIFYKSMSSQDL